MPDYISKLNKFLENKCPLPNHWCNGQPIKNQATIKLPPCQYYIPRKGCMHPENPKNRKKRTAQRSRWNDIEGFNDRFYIDKQNPRVEVEISEV